MIPPFPLKWPEGRARTPWDERRYRAADRSVADAMKLAETAIEEVGGSDVVVTSNAKVHNAQPADPGVSIWFWLGGVQKVIAVDRYRSFPQNLGAAAMTAEYLRRIRLHGGIELFEQAISGFDALPMGASVPAREGQAKASAPPPSARPWFDVLGVLPSAPLAQCEAMYRFLIKELHPDTGGDTDSAAELNRAIEEARQLKGDKS